VTQIFKAMQGKEGKNGIGARGGGSKRSGPAAQAGFVGFFEKEGGGTEKNKDEKKQPGRQVGRINRTFGGTSDGKGGMRRKRAADAASGGQPLGGNEAAGGACRLIQRGGAAKQPAQKNEKKMLKAASKQSTQKREQRGGGFENSTFLPRGRRVRPGGHGEICSTKSAELRGKPNSLKVQKKRKIKGPTLPRKTERKSGEGQAWELA